MKCFETSKLTSLLIFFIFVVFANTLDIQIDGMATNRQEFCVGEVLTFVCPLENVGSFQWTIPEFLNISNGVITVGGGGTLNMETLGFFMLTAEGFGSNTRSTLQVAAFNGLSEVVCTNSINPSQSLSGTVKVLGMFVV